MTPATPPQLPSGLLPSGLLPRSDEQARSLKCLQVSSPTAEGRRIRRSPFSAYMRKVGAEFVGTFVMVFSAAGGPIVNQKYGGLETLIGNAACAGLAVMVVILSLGHISGAHLNPAVTAAFAATRHLPLVEVPGYIMAQISGSLLASFTLKGIFHPFISGGLTLPTVGGRQAFALEFIVTFSLMLVIVAVATDTKAVGEMAGIAIGGTVMLNILVAGPSSGASMNPARTLGPAVAAGKYTSLWIYMVAPVLGAMAGAIAYTVLKDSDEQASRPCTLRCFGRSETPCEWKGFTVAITECKAMSDDDVSS
ncbi:hypothetical protein SAY87_014553 [Trapa incisa]|uniref:Uncharacterized protein n=1 Tax=Trapa incisa TaxID=236973 RepID=A0AAN7JKJ6_9MYRT|nr:hypothetical protein SAY87_014553 [Trapa incisa]